MSSGFEMGVELDEWNDFVKQAKTELSEDARQFDLEVTAQEGRRDLVELTPKKSGVTRDAWRVLPGEDGGKKIQNTEAAMMFLEQGTRDHGPVNAKALFIPLRPTVLPKKGGGSKYIFGVDFILTKKVRGIKPMNIVKNYMPIILQKLMERVNKRLQNLGAS